MAACSSIYLGQLVVRAGETDSESFDFAEPAFGQTMPTFGEPRRAAEAFREVLRLNPGLNEARDLLLSALKSRNPVYRVLSRPQERFRGTWLMLLLLPVAPSLIVVFVLIAVLHWAAWVAEAWLTLRLAHQHPAGQRCWDWPAPGPRSPPRGGSRC